MNIYFNESSHDFTVLIKASQEYSERWGNYIPDELTPSTQSHRLVMSYGGVSGWEAYITPVDSLHRGYIDTTRRVSTAPDSLSTLPFPQIYRRTISSLNLPFTAHISSLFSQLTNTTRQIPPIFIVSPSAFPKKRQNSPETYSIRIRSFNSLFPTRELFPLIALLEWWLGHHSVRRCR